MVFSSSIFLFAFLPVCLFIYYVFLKNKRTAQNYFLTIASLFFYAWGEPVFVLIMIGSIFANWLFALWVNKIRDSKPLVKLVITLTLICNLSVLFVFKYLMFALTNANLLFNKHLEIPNIALPIGISFFTFQAISYVIDVYRKNGAVQKNPMNVALYIAFFPQLIAGPIVRYQTIADQIQNRKETFKDFSEGLTRFTIGLAKKMIISNNMALIADSAFKEDNLSISFAWFGAIAYTLQIFFDFSGYSDMAIGLGRMFGFHFLENFNYPYISKSISEFWRRWHISLGSWFRDYVYFPLGGSRVNSKCRLVFNLFVVWFLTGIWHGANWTFIVWGLMYFVLITLEKLTGFDKKLKWFGHIYTLFFVVIGWVLFRALSITDAYHYLQTMFGLSTHDIMDNNTIFFFMENKFYLLAGLILSFPIARVLKTKFGNTKVIKVLEPIAVLLLFIVSISFVVKGAYNPFIYFNF